MPATALRRIFDLPPQITELRGTVWNGSATLVDGYVLHWNSHLASLIVATISADVTLAGADTQLTGRISVSPWAVDLQNLSGRAGPGLLALVPDLGVENCASQLDVDIGLVRLGGGRAAAQGQIDVSPGDCVDFAGEVVPVPAILVALKTIGNDAVADVSDARTALGQFTVAGDRRWVIRVEPAGAALIPGLPVSGPIILEYPF